MNETEFLAKLDELRKQVGNDKHFIAGLASYFDLNAGNFEGNDVYVGYYHIMIPNLHNVANSW